MKRLVHFRVRWGWLQKPRFGENFSWFKLISMPARTVNFAKAVWNRAPPPLAPRHRLCAKRRGVVSQPRLLPFEPAMKAFVAALAWEARGLVYPILPLNGSHEGKAVLGDSVQHGASPLVLERGHLWPCGSTGSWGPPPRRMPGSGGILIGPVSLTPAASPLPSQGVLGITEPLGSSSWAVMFIDFVVLPTTSQEVVFPHRVDADGARSRHGGGDTAEGRPAEPLPGAEALRGAFAPTLGTSQQREEPEWGPVTEAGGIVGLCFWTAAWD